MLRLKYSINCHGFFETNLCMGQSSYMLTEWVSILMILTWSLMGCQPGMTCITFSTMNNKKFGHIYLHFFQYKLAFKEVDALKK